MAGDIEDFLRRAAQRRAQQPLQAPKAERRPGEAIVDAEVVEPPVLHGGSVAEHVASHLREGVFDQQVARLGEEVDQADDRMEARLQQRFAHELGQLGAVTARPQDSILDDDSSRPLRPAPAMSIVELLRNPESVRQAIILNEILKRPTFDE